MLDIPVFHDDQHGTAIITGAALLNALEITGKSISDIKVVVCGAGAAALACSEFYVTMGARGRTCGWWTPRAWSTPGGGTNMNPYKERFAAATDERTLADAVRGADVFLGLSGKDLLTPEMLRYHGGAADRVRLREPRPRDPATRWRGRRGRT